MSDALSELRALRARQSRLELLLQVSGVIHSTLDPQEALQLIVREAVRLVGANSGSVVLYNPINGFLEIQASFGLPDQASQLKLRPGEGITGWVAQTGQPARVADVNQDSRYIRVHPAARAELAVPLEVRGEVRGVLNVDADRADAFTSEDQALLEELARHAARVIQNTWLYEQQRLQVESLEALRTVGQTINSTLNLDEVLQAITREGCGLMQARLCSLRLLDESREWLDLRAHFGAGSAYLGKPRLSVTDSALGVVVRRKKPIQIENVQMAGRYQSVEIARQEGLVSLLSVPLLHRGQALGALSVYAGVSYRFSDQQTRLLGALAELSALAIEKARLYERVVDLEEQLRQSDQLSALGLLAAEVAHEIRNPLAVMKLLFHSLDLRFPPEDPRSKDAQIITEKMDHLNRIVEQVLDFARISEPCFQAVSVNRLIDDLCLLTRHKLTQQGIQLVRQLAPDLPPLPADPTQIEQAFLNLTLNAVEAMPRGGRLTLRSRAVRWSRRSPAPTHVVVEFADTGPGLSEEQRRRLFSSLLHTTKAKGTGLGLAIVRRVVESHEGRLQLTSRPGRGTSIRLLLPLHRTGGPPSPG